MKKYILLLFIMIPLLSYGKTDMEKLLERVDYAIEMDGYYKQQKEKELKRLRRLAGDATTDEEELRYLDSLYRAYSTYRYDSACAYVRKGLQLAEATHNTFYINCFKIHRASVLSVGGFYAKAEDILETLDPKQMPYEQKLYYYFTYAWLFNYWESYAAKSEFVNEFKNQKKHYMGILLDNFNEKSKKSAYYQYLKGENIYLSSPTHKSVLEHYLKAFKMTAKNDRLHPMAAYGIARYYRDLEQYDLYVKYLVEASESDGICQLMETTALQKLAYYLYQTDKNNSKRATRYIQHSMEDAQFFNNRLRMMEISNIQPVIAANNQQAAERSRTHMEIGLICACIILTIILILTVVNTKQKNSLKKSRKEIAAQNKQLAELNKRLIDTNKRRETYMSLFMDISALYIRKLDDYRKLVSRKVKAKQTDDLLKSINSFKLAEEESSMFYIRFDKAFMELYPNFVQELNTLLKPEHHIVLPSPTELTTEVRIYALMRLGVTDSQEIATLLYYSTQTIYNYKSGMRAKALNRETFESDINRLCHII